MFSTILLSMDGQLHLWTRDDDRHATTVEETLTKAAPRALPSADVEQLDAAVERFAERAFADNTRRAYRGDWRRFQAWCERAGCEALPATPDTLARYLAALAEAGRKPSTIERARVAITMAHAWAGEPRPDDRHVRAVERGIRRTLCVREEGAPPFTPDEILRMVRALGRGPRAERDRAILLLGFAAALRGSELVDLQVDDLHFDDGCVTVLVRFSKEDPEGKGETVKVPCDPDPDACPVAAVQRWLARRTYEPGPLFLRLHRGGQVLDQGLTSSQSITAIVRHAAQAAGLDAKKFSGHSLRGGCATTADARGYDKHTIRRHGRWRSDRSLRRYLHWMPEVRVL